VAEVVFYEKSGCINNSKQKQWLAAAGHRLVVIDLLRHPWTPESLRPFFGEKPVAQWFNRTAPAVKRGEVDPDRMEAEDALRLMVRDPLLVKRPLLESGGCKMSGFDVEAVRAWIGLDAGPGEEDAVRRLEQEDLNTCPMITRETSCDEKAK